MKNILKYINSIPFEFTIKHYQTFGKTNAFLNNNELNSPESWDVLRKNHPQFSISQDRAEWLRACEAEVKKDGQDGGLKQRAIDVVGLIKKEGIKKIFSVGVGGAGLEYQIKKKSPEVRLTCSEYAPENVVLLRDVFLEADEIISFDVFRGDWDHINKKYLGEDAVCLMYRVDASFNDTEWRSIFEKMSLVGVKKILFIPSSFLTIRSIINRKLREFKWRFSDTPILFSGYLRSKNRFQSYWSCLYNESLFEFGGLKGFLLKLK
jgi:hypothetical protein